MAPEKKRRLFCNFILALALLTALGLTLLRAGSMTSLALEQQPRCAHQEHLHTPQCYVDEVLVCGRKAHVHGDGCYLLLLGENDINALLEALDADPSHSLEELLEMLLGRLIPGYDGDIQHLSAEQIRVLNRTLAADPDLASLLLNERLGNPAMMIGETENAQSQAEAPGDYQVGVYMYLDGAWVNRKTLSMVNSTYNSYVKRADVVSALTQNTVIDSTVLQDDLYYTSTNPATQLTGLNSISSSAANITFYFFTSNTTRYILPARWVEYGVYDLIPFHTVTLDYSGVGLTNAVQYVQSGMASTLTPNFTDYIWTDDNGSVVTADNIDDYLGAVSGKVTLHASVYTVEEYDITYYVKGTAIHTDTVEAGSSYVIGKDVAIAGDYAVWRDNATGVDYPFTASEADRTITVTEDRSYTALRYVTARFQDEYGNEAAQPQTVLQGQTVTLPETHHWVDEDGNTFQPGQTVTLDEDTDFTGTLRTVTVTYVDAAGVPYDREYPYGSTITLDPLPVGYGWNGSDGAAYRGGGSFGPLTRDMTFTAAPRTITVSYDVNFHSGVTPTGGIPTISGTDSYTASDAVTGGASTTTRDLTARKTYRVFAEGNKEGVTYLFRGWKVAGTDILIQPQATIVWSELESYADASGSVNLQGVWTEGYNVNSVTFYVRYDSVAVDTDGNIHQQPTGSYTPCVFYTYLGGMDMSKSWWDLNAEHNIADTTSDNSFGADQAIRALYGERANGIWMYDFPRDEDVFAYLRELLASDSSKHLYIDGEALDPETLSVDNYAIRWYVFKREDDGWTWHVDGKLVRREGNIDISKAFSGDETAIELAEDGFYIVARNGTKNEDGSFQPYALDDEKYRQVILVLSQEDADELKLREEYANDKTVFQVVDEADIDIELTLILDPQRADILKNQHTDPDAHVSIRNAQQKRVTMMLDEGDAEAVQLRFPDAQVNPAESDPSQYVVIVDTNVVQAGQLKRDYPDAIVTPLEDDITMRQVTLTLSKPEAEALMADYEGTDISTRIQLRTWQIHRVSLNEYWQVTEYPPDVPGYSFYAEYSVYDTDGGFTAVAVTGTEASVVGKTFALDEDPEQGMKVNFSNYYYDENNVLLKKEDLNTGDPIPGAVFRIYQKDQLLKFDYFNGVYIQNPDGAISDITIGDNGFAQIASFSYKHDSLTIKEVTAPVGYDQAPDVVIGLKDPENGSAPEVIVKNVANVDSEEWDDYAEVPENNVAVIKDKVSEYVSVTVTKKWDTTEPASSVGIALQANGGNAAALIPGLKNAQVTLNADNSWTYTWTDLPRYANGLELKWGVKEVSVGSDGTMSDGVSFANWIVSYSPASTTDDDKDGDIDNWAYTVTNTNRRHMLILTKVDPNGKVLSGAAFRMERVDPDNNWQVMPDEPVDDQTTGASGTLVFDNLIAGAYYRLTETSAPLGYEVSMDPVIITIDGNGVVYRGDTQKVLSEPFIRYTGFYNVRVTNPSMGPLPETGGAGTFMYTQSGLLLLAAALYIYINKRRREESVSP